MSKDERKVSKMSKTATHLYILNKAQESVKAMFSASFLTLLYYVYD